MSTRTFPQASNTSLRPDRRRWSWIIGGVLALLFVLGLAASCAQPQVDRPSRPVPATESAEPAPVAVLPPTPDVTLPSVEGRNGKVVLDELRGLGLTAVRAAYQGGAESVPQPENWIVTGIDPAAGSIVRADVTVVVTMARSAPVAAHTPAPEPEVTSPRTHTSIKTYETQVPVPERRSAPEAPSPEVTRSPVSVYYKNCDAVRAAGAAPIHRGEPGYSSKLDRDDDGIGCEN